MSTKGQVILKKGAYTGAQLAEWFGIKPASFRATKAKKLKELEVFAKFHEEGSNIIIDEVMIPVFSKRSERTYEAIKDNFDSSWNKSGLDSCSRVALEIGDKIENIEGVHPTESTTYEYTRKVRNELYGKPFIEGGSLGRCSYEWCKKIGEGIDAMYEHFTPEEVKIKDEIIKKHFGNTTEKQLLVKGMVESGEVTEAEAWQVLENLTGMNREENFLSFLNDMEAAFGCRIVRGTMLLKDNEAVEKDCAWFRE